MRKPFISIIAAMALTVTAQAKEASFYDLEGPTKAQEDVLMCKYDSSSEVKIDIFGGSYDTPRQGPIVIYLDEIKHNVRAIGTAPVPKEIDIKVTWKTNEGVIPASIKTLESKYTKGVTHYENKGSGDGINNFMYVEMQASAGYLRIITLESNTDAARARGFIAMGLGTNFKENTVNGVENEEYSPALYRCYISER